MLLQVRRHTTSHYAETDKTNFHIYFFVKLP